MRVTALALLVTLATSPLRAEDPAPPVRHSGDRGAPARSACREAEPRCAQTAEPAFARDGRLWVAFAVGNAVYVASSRDRGAHFEPAVAVARVADGVIDANGEARPKIVALPDGTLVASYTARAGNSYNGAIAIARSSDGGKSFSAPQPLIEGVGQRFETFVVSPEGRLYAAWLDKRDAEDAKKAGEDFAGSGLAVAWSDDGGKTFSGKKILMDHSCECCRVAAALDRDGLPAFAWRHVFEGNLRDHYVAKLSAGGARLVGGRVSEDNWATGCPHHGPSLAIDAAGAWHVVWFANGKTRKGLFHAQSVDGGKTFSQPAKFGDDARAPSHPALLATRRELCRVWKEFDGRTTNVLLQVSQDGGRSWTGPRAVASTADASDHPVLIENKGVAYLSWLTREEGYRLLLLSRRRSAAASIKK